jgi:hypothetical protein
MAMNAKRGYARKHMDDDGSWELVVGKSGEPEKVRRFKGSPEEADAALLEFYRETFQGGQKLQ